MPRKKPPPRVATLNISIDGFRDRQFNGQRINVGLELIQLASKSSIDCLCFPAGYLLAKNEVEIPTLIGPILQQARKSNVSFVIGVDTAAILSYPADPNSPKMLKAVRKGTIPCFLVAYSHQQDILQIHRQRSCTSFHATSRILPDDNSSTKEIRFMPLGTTGFRILACGEIFDRRMVARGPIDSEPLAVIANYHTTYSRMSRTLSSISRTGVSILAMQHMKGQGSLLHNWTCGENLSVYARPCPVGGGRGGKDGPWIDMAVWELTKQGFRAARSRPSSFI